MGPPAYSPYPGRLESLTICWCNYKDSTFYSVILRPWVLVRPESNSRPPAWQPDAQPTEPPVRGKKTVSGSVHLRYRKIKISPKVVRCSLLSCKIIKAWWALPWILLFTVSSISWVRRFSMVDSDPMRPKSASYHATRSYHCTQISRPSHLFFQVFLYSFFHSDTRPDYNKESKVK